MSTDSGEQQPDKTTVSTTNRSGKKVDITVTKVAAGALASVTAAVAGSKLGIGGTITGAAVVSVVSTVGTALYQHSLERTRARVRTRALTTRQVAISPGQQAVLLRHRADADGATRRIPLSRTGPASQRAAEPATVRFSTSWQRTPLTAAAGLQAAQQHTAQQHTAQQHTVQHAHPDSATEQPTVVHRPVLPPTSGQQVPAPRAEDRSPAPDQPDDRARANHTVRWALLAAGAIVVFAAGLLGLTGIELVTGQPVAGGPPGSTTLGIGSRPAPTQDHRPGQPGVLPTERPATRTPATGSSTANPASGAPAPSSSTQPSVEGTPSQTPSAPATSVQPTGPSSIPAQPTTQAPIPTPSQAPTQQ